jgi:hypothetical protein
LERLSGATLQVVADSQSRLISVAANSRSNNSPFAIHCRSPLRLPLPLQQAMNFVNAARQRLDVGSSVNSGFDFFKRPIA